jgi:hypothetical protein
MRGKIEKNIFNVYGDSNQLVYSTPIKQSNNYVYFDTNINKDFIGLLKQTIPKGSVLVCDYDQSFLTLGFKNPQMCKPGGICLYHGGNGNGGEDVDYITREYEFLSTQLYKDHCEIILKLKESALEKLKHIISENKDETKEIFGSFKIVENRKEGGRIIHTLDIIASSLKSGSTDDVSASPTVYNFHTHPVSAYKMYKVKYGPPSVQDYTSIYTLCKTYHCVVHFVASIEGIYIVYLLPGVKGSKTNIIKTIEKNFKYNEKKVELRAYIDKLNSMEIFSISLLDWQDPTLRTGIPIQFRKSGEWGNCKIRDD